MQAARFFLWEARPAANGARSVPKASPRGRASHKLSPCMALRCAGRALFCGSRDPRRIAPARCPKSFAPTAGLPQIEPVHGAASCRSHAFLWEARRRLGAQKASPRGRGSHKLSPCMASIYTGRTLFCRSRAPRRMAPARCPNSFAPRAGLPQIEPVHGAALCRSHAFLWEARRRLGAQSFAPRSGLPQIEPEHGAASCRSHGFSV